MSPRAALLFTLGLGAFAASASGCQGGLTDEAPLPALDRAYFDCKVQPVLTKSCGAFACHGDERRFLRLYGRNRLRLELPESQRNAFMTPDERAANYDAARAFVEIGSPETSWLVLKPLEMSQGGYFHGGEELFKRGNVFFDKEDKDYKTLADWVNGAKEDPSCFEPGSDQ